MSLPERRGAGGLASPVRRGLRWTADAPASESGWTTSPYSVASMSAQGSFAAGAGAGRAGQRLLDPPQRLGHGLRVLRPPGGGLGQQLEDQVGERGRGARVLRRGRRRGVHGQRHHGRDGVDPTERQLAGGHLVEHDAQAEQVGAVVHGGPLGLLRAHVRRRADGRPLPRHRVEPRPVRARVAGAVGVGLGGRPGQPEVEDLHPPLVPFEPDVGRLDVAVDEAARVRRRQPLGHLPADPQHLRRRRPRAGPQRRPERLALQQGHRQVRDAAVLGDLVDDDDVVVLDGRLGAGLAEEPGLGGRVAGHLREHDLQRDGAAEGGILGLEDDAHAAVAEDVQHAVRPEPAQLARPLRRRQERREGVRRGLGGVLVRAGLAPRRLPHRAFADQAGPRVRRRGRGERDGVAAAGALGRRPGREAAGRLEGRPARRTGKGCGGHEGESGRKGSSIGITLGQPVPGRNGGRGRRREPDGREGGGRVAARISRPPLPRAARAGTLTRYVRRRPC